MPLEFTFEFPAIVRTASSTAPTFQLGDTNARNSLQRARLSADVQEMPLELWQAAEFLIKGEQIPSNLQTKLYSLGPKQQNLTIQEALSALSTPPRGACSLVGITSDYENYKQIDIPAYLRALAEEQLLTKAIARNYNVKSLQEAGIDLLQIYTQEELDKLQIKQDTSNAALYRLADGTYEIFSKIPNSLKGSNVYVLGVEKDDSNENLLTSVLKGSEFEDYQFEDDDQTTYTVHLRVCLQNQNLHYKNAFSIENETQSLIKLIQDNPIVCDYNFVTDANCGINTISNFVNVGISTLSESIKTKNKLQNNVELNGFLEFFSALKEKEIGSLSVIGCDVFKNFVLNVTKMMKNEVDKISSETSFEEIISNKMLFQVLTGSFAEKLDYRHFLRPIFKSVVENKFDSGMFIENILFLHDGVQQTIDTRLALATKRSYIQKSQHHSVSSSYALWAGSQSLLQYQLTDTEKYDEIVNNIVYVFVNPKDSASNKVNLNAKNAINALQTKLHNQKKPEAIIDFSDHILGYYLHQDRPFEGIQHPFLDYNDIVFDQKHALLYQTNVFKQQPQFQFKLDLNQEIPDYEELNSIYSKVPSNQSLRITQLNKKFIGVHPVSNILPDSKLTFNKTEFLAKLQEFGYKIQQEESESEDNNDIQDIPKTYLHSMLEKINGDIVSLTNSIEIIIPHIFVDLLNIKNIADFKNQTPDNLQKFGFNVQELSLFVDLCEYGSTISPFLLYDATIGYYYVPAFFNQTQSLYSNKTSLSQIDISKVLSAAVTQKIDAIPETTLIQSNIMTLLDINQVYRKLAQSIREYRTQNFSCFNIMGRQIQEVLDKNNYIEKFRSILNYPEGMIDFYYPTNIDKQLITQENNEQLLNKNKSLSQILDEKPAYVQDLYCEHESLYKFASENLDVLFDIFNGLEFEFPHIEFEMDSFEFYSTQYSQASEQKAFTSCKTNSIEQISFLNLKTHQIPTSFEQFTPQDFLLISRQRGYQIHFLLKNQLISPDLDLLNIQKFFNFSSANEIFQKFKCQNKINEESNISLQKIKSDFMSAPLFKRYSILEKIGKEPIYDIFGRILRVAAPYGQFSTPSNIPAPLEVEAPPPPQAGGEEQTMDEIIKFWTKFNNQFYCLDQNVIDTLLSPVFSLEQRAVEIINLFGPATIACAKEDDLVNQVKNNTILACQCTNVNFVFYPPSNNFMQLENFMRGIYYMSPYYLPKAQISELERIQTFTKTSTYAISVICQLLRDGLDRFCGLPSLQPQARPAPVCFTEIVTAYFIVQTPENTFKHILDLCTPNSKCLQGKSKKRELIPKQNREIDFRQTRSKILDSLLHRSRQLSGDKILLSEVIKNAEFWTDSTTFADKLLEISPLIDIIIVAHPILNIINYGEPSDDSAFQPLEIHKFLSLGGLGKQEFEERKLEEQLAMKREVIDEILDELIHSQNLLKELEITNRRDQINAFNVLNQQKSIDLHDEFCDLYTTFVNFKWSKCCYLDRKIHPQTKVAPDQMISGGFETGGPDIEKVGEWFNGELSELARMNCLGFGDFEWQSDGFQICDIVEFE